MQARGVLRQSSRSEPLVIFSASTDFRPRGKEPAAVMSFQTEYVEPGGLMSYSANLNDLARRAATYVDKILKGQSLPICRWSNQRSSISSSISKRPSRSA